MRKFLSLALALVMVLSLTLVSASAKSFTDNNDVDYNEAVDVISALNIVDGYPDGSFNPSGLLTRQAAAKIICNLILGPTTAASLKADAAPFYDVPVDNGFAGYIAYCASRGIIGGYGDGSFQPGGYLSGNAFMKMLLGALGYDATIEQFVGPNWTINVGKLAMGIGLTDDLDGEFDGSKTVNRQEAALYALNTLQATMVDYGQKIVITDANGNAQVVGHSDATNVGEGQYASYDNHKTEGGAASATLQFCERYFEDLKKTTTSDDFERPAHTWKIKTNEVGTYVDSGDLIASWTTKVTKDDLYNTLGKSVIDDLKSTADDCKNAKLYYYVDGAVIVNGAKDDETIDSFAFRKDTDKINGDAATTGNGALTEVYLDKDTNAVTIVTINTYVFQASSDYNSSRDEVKIAAAGDTSAFNVRLDDYNLDGGDFDIAGVKEDDYLLITAYVDGGSYKVASVEPAESVVGEVTAYSADDKVTVDGGEYSYSLKTYKEKDKIAGAENVKSMISSTGGQVSLIMDKYGYVIAIDDTVTSGNYVFILEANNANQLASSKVIAHAYFPDGTVDDITLKKVGGSTSKSSLKGAHGWYTYSKDSSGSYNLNEVKGSYATDCLIKQTDITTATTLISSENARLYGFGTAQSIRANERTIYVIEDEDGDVYSYTGVSSAPTITLTSGTYSMGYVWNKNNGYASYVFITVDGADANVDSSTESDMYVFLLKLDKTINNGTDTIYRYKAIVDGEVTTIDADDDSYTINKLYTKVKIDSNKDLITGMRELDGPAAGDAHDNKYHKSASLKDARVIYKSGVLTIGTESFIIPGDAALNIVIAGGLQNKDLLVDKGADYETHEMVSGSSFAAAVSGYLVDCYYYVVTKDDYATGNSNDRNVKTLYMYVSDCTLDKGQDGSGTPDVPPAGDDEFTVNYTIDDVPGSVTAKKGETAIIEVGKEIASATPVGTIVGTNVHVTEDQISDDTVVVIVTKKTEEAKVDANITLDGPGAKYITEAHIITSSDDTTGGKYASKNVGDLYVAWDLGQGATGKTSVTLQVIKNGLTSDIGSGVNFRTLKNTSYPAASVPSGSFTLFVPELVDSLEHDLIIKSDVSGLSFKTTTPTVKEDPATGALKLEIVSGLPAHATEVKVTFTASGLDENPTVSAVTKNEDGSYSFTKVASSGAFGGGVGSTEVELFSAATAKQNVTLTITDIEVTKQNGEVDVTTKLDAVEKVILSENSFSAGIADELTKGATPIDLKTVKTGEFTLATNVKSVMVSYEIEGVTAVEGNDAGTKGKAEIKNTGSKVEMVLKQTADATQDANNAKFSIAGNDPVRLIITSIDSVTFDGSKFSNVVLSAIDTKNTGYTVSADDFDLVKNADGAWVNKDEVTLKVTRTDGWTALTAKASIEMSKGAAFLPNNTAKTTDVPSAVDAGTPLNLDLDAGTLKITDFENDIRVLLDAPAP